MLSENRYNFLVMGIGLFKSLLVVVHTPFGNGYWFIQIFTPDTTHSEISGALHTTPCEGAPHKES
jgi:hypothetical protein